MTLTMATITVGEPHAAGPIDVQFNPTSLRVTTTNQLEDGNPNSVSKATSFKLDVELLFDSTETGQDVHLLTRPLRMAARATAQAPTGATGSSGGGGGGEDEEPERNLSEVTFSWAATHYHGYIESINETLDYWSSDGTALRCTMQISIKGRTENFLTGRDRTSATHQGENSFPEPLDMVMMPDALDSDRVFTQATSSGGDRSTGRGLAALNGAENMRTGAGAFAGASAGAFAGAGAGAGASAFAGAGASAGAGVAACAGGGAGVSLQAAAGFKLSGGVSAGASAGFGIGASAGLSAGAGLGASVGVGMAAGMGGGAGIGIGGGIGAGIGAGAGISMGASAGIGASAGFSAGAGIGAGGAASSFSSFAGTSTSVTSGSASAGLTASSGAFAGLGGSAGTRLPSADFNVNRLLPPPSVPTANATFDLSGRATSGGGVVAESWSFNSSSSG